MPVLPVCNQLLRGENDHSSPVTRLLPKSCLLLGSNYFYQTSTDVSMATFVNMKEGQNSIGFARGDKSDKETQPKAHTPLFCLEIS